MYDPSAVRILVVRLRMEDCRGCSQAISKDCSMLCKSTLLSTASNFSNISQTACSCINFLVLSWSHSTVVGDCSGVSLNRENWIFFAIYDFESGTTWLMWVAILVRGSMHSISFHVLTTLFAVHSGTVLSLLWTLEWNKIIYCNEYNEMKESKSDGDV